MEAQVRSLSGIQVKVGVPIPLRDGVRLAATLYLPGGQDEPVAAIVTLTPYLAQTYHGRGMFFAARGYAFLAVDVRGRGDSEGLFEPNINEARDGFDVVEWTAAQSFCSGKVAMWGGSYAGYAQWAAAKECPPHLVTIVPTASPCFGLDFPWRSGIPTPYVMRWLSYVAGRASHETLFADQGYWNRRFLEFYKSRRPFRELDEFLGLPSPVFQEWVANSDNATFWARYNPTPAEYARISIPVLTITGAYDGDQPGALEHYRQHRENRPDAEHYLVIGPWDHAGTRTPALEFCGLKAGAASLVDLGELHCAWYAWVLGSGKRPEFLRGRVAYYVLGAEAWRYTDRLDHATGHHVRLHLHGDRPPTDVFQSGSLQEKRPLDGAEDAYTFDPSDVAMGELESTLPRGDLTDQTLIHANRGRHLVYHSAPLARQAELCGFFSLSAWLSVDCPEVNLLAAIYAIGPDGGSVLLSNDLLRAGNEGQDAPTRYDFKGFAFTSRTLPKGARLRLVLSCADSIHLRRPTGGVEKVHVRLHRGGSWPSALDVPLATDSWTEAPGDA